MVAMAAASAQAAPAGQLLCEVRYGSDTQRLRVAPTTSPYDAPLASVADRFAFRAVVRERDGRVDHIALAVYDLTLPESPVMLSQTHHAPPFVGGAQVPALTGWQEVHASGLGRHMRYGCAWDGAPGEARAPAARPPHVPKAAHDVRASETVTLAFMGDVMLADGPGRAVRRGVDPFAQIAPLWRDADARIANLECVVSDRGQPMADKPYTFRAHPRVMPLLKRHVDVVSLANNHAGDYGRAAFSDMLARLKRAGVAHVGGGRTLREAHAPHIIERKGLRIALLAYNEMFPRHFEAGPAHPGQAWSDDASVLADIEDARRVHGADLVIPFMHWGEEHRATANDRQRELARRMIDAGADAVVGTHPHVVQDTETYLGRPIIYSLGNLIFDGFSDADNNTGWVLRLRMDRNGVVDWHTHTVHMDREGIPRPARP